MSRLRPSIVGVGPARATRNLFLATVAFAVAFVGWSLIAPLAKRFQDDLDLTNTRTLMLTAVPVVDEGRLVGVISRAVLQRRLAEDEEPPPADVDVDAEDP